MTKVKHAEIRLCEIPLAYDYQLSNTLLTDTQVVVLLLEDEEGRVGIGEADAMVPFTNQHSGASILALLRDNLHQILKSVDISNINILHERIDAVLGEENVLPRSPIDVAAHDLTAKTLDVPVAALLGGPVRESIEILQPLSSDSVESTVAKARDDVAEGFSSLMLKTGHYSVGKDLERLERVRDAVGEEVNIVVDANQGWKVQEAIRFARGAEEYDIDFIEQPVPAGNLQGLKQVRDSTMIPISADESLFTIADARRLIRANAVDVFSIKVAKHGGIHHSRRIIELADTYGIPVFMNSMIETGISQSASLQLGISSPNLLPLGHAYMSTLRLDANFTDFADLITTQGTIHPSQSAGLGVEIADNLPEYTVETHEIEFS